MCNTTGSVPTGGVPSAGGNVSTFTSPTNSVSSPQFQPIHAGRGTPGSSVVWSAVKSTRSFASVPNPPLSSDHGATTTSTPIRAHIDASAVTSANPPVPAPTLAASNTTTPMRFNPIANTGVSNGSTTTSMSINSAGRSAATSTGRTTNVDNWGTPVFVRNQKMTHNGELNRYATTTSTGTSTGASTPHSVRSGQQILKNGL
jgi:hypothetical protein